MSESGSPQGGVSPQPEEKPPKHPVDQCCDKIFESFKENNYCQTLQTFEELQAHDLESFMESTPSNKTSIVTAWGRALQAAWKMSGDEEHVQEMLEDYEERFSCDVPQYLAVLLAEGDSIIECLQNFAVHTPPPLESDAVAGLMDKFPGPYTQEEVGKLIEMMQSLNIPVEGAVSEKLQWLFVKRMKNEDPEDVLAEMISLGIKPSIPHPYNFIFMKPNIKTPGKTIVDFYYEMLDNGIKPAESTYRILGRKATVSREDGAMFRRRLKGETTVEERYKNQLHKCQTENNEDEAAKIYRRMLLEGIQPDKYVFNYIILTCRRNPERAEQWYNEMLKQGVQPNAVTFTNLITVFKETKEIDAADRWMEEMRKQGIQIDQHNLAAMLDSYVKAGQRSKAMHCFKTMIETDDCNIVAYNSVMKLGPFDFALGCLACMLAEGIQPSHHTRSHMHHMGRDQFAVEMLDELEASGWLKEKILVNPTLTTPPKGTHPSITDCMRLMFREIKLDSEYIEKRTAMLNQEIANCQ